MFVIENEGEYYKYMPVGAFDSANWTSDKSKAHWFETYDEADEVANAVWNVIGGCVNVRNDRGDLV